MSLDEVAEKTQPRCSHDWHCAVAGNLCQVQGAAIQRTMARPGPWPLGSAYPSGPQPEFSWPSAQERTPHWSREERTRTKPPPPPAPLTTFQRAQMRFGEVASSVESEVQSRVETAAKEVGRGLKAADEKWGISESAAKVGAQVADKANELDARHSVSKAVGELGKKAGGALRTTADAVTSAVDSAGVTHALDKYAVRPGRNLAEAVSSSKTYKSALNFGGGSLRRSPRQRQGACPSKSPHLRPGLTPAGDW